MYTYITSTTWMDGFVYILSKKTCFHNWISVWTCITGKKLKPASRIVPLSQSTLTTHTPSPSSRFSSKSAMRLFSLTHTSSRSSGATAAARKAKHTTKASPKNLSHAEKIGPCVDDLLKETSGEQPSLSELLADGTLWDS